MKAKIMAMSFATLLFVSMATAAFCQSDSSSVSGEEWFFAVLGPGGSLSVSKYFSVIGPFPGQEKCHELAKWASVYKGDVSPCWCGRKK